MQSTANISFGHWADWFGLNGVGNSLALGWQDIDQAYDYWESVKIIPIELI
jgi:hypothetical protein